MCDVRLDVPAGKVEVVVEHRGQACCPQCGKACPGYDVRQRRWRHLGTCQLQTVLVADVLRVECPEHGVLQAATPWSDPGSRFTALFERVVVDCLKEASFSAVARRLGLTWYEVDGIMARAVERGLERRGACEPRRIGLDATSFQKRYEYVTVVTDLDGRRVLSVLEGTKYLWLESPSSMRTERRSLLSPLKDACTRTGRAWELKEMASKLWDYVSVGWARRAWLAWAALASRSKLEPMVRAARMVRKHLDDILIAIVLRATNAAAESMNPRIQRIKAMACGYRNRERVRNAILFHLGGLDLYPRPVLAHTTS